MRVGPTLYRARITRRSPRRRHSKRKAYELVARGSTRSEGAVRYQPSDLAARVRPSMYSRLVRCREQGGLQKTVRCLSASARSIGTGQRTAFSCRPSNENICEIQHRWRTARRGLPDRCHAGSASREFVGAAAPDWQPSSCYARRGP